MCFDGLVKEIECHLYDVDAIGTSTISETNLGSGSIAIDSGPAQHNIRMRLSDIKKAQTGTLVMDIAYIYEHQNSGLLHNVLLCSA